MNNAKLPRKLALACVGLLSLAPVLRAADSASLAPLSWITTGPLVHPTPDERHPIVAVKDPSVVFHDGRWHIFATTASSNGWRMAYLNFTSWDQAAEAKLAHLEDNPHFTGDYNCAPQVFYFRPHKKWYLIFQSQQPRFSTTDNIADVMSWSKPQDFFEGTPKSVVEGWIDYWIICDDTHAYLFFSDDHGRFYRSRTRIEDFPRGFDEPVIVMQEANRADLFEGSCVYRIKGTNQFLCLVECADKNWDRYLPRLHGGSPRRRVEAVARSGLRREPLRGQPQRERRTGRHPLGERHQPRRTPPRRQRRDHDGRSEKPAAPLPRHPARRHRARLPPPPLSSRAPETRARRSHHSIRSMKSPFLLIVRNP